jgi:uncharacterized protein YyaL (SSP411 family)
LATAPRPAHAANRLARESSPYLLQHAHNPVDWYPWGPEAIAEARRRNVPIFLSIGYSTCYWCHVMERESFEDPATAAVMNERYVNVKLDREERPDLDEVYMAAVQTLTGRGGWPMSVFLEPQGLRPFWAGTYFPPRPAHGMPSFTQVLMGLSEAFASQRDQIDKQAEEVASAVREKLAAEPAPAALGVEQVAMAAQTLLTIFDRAHGGFGGSPKFPQPVYLELLLDVRAGADEQTREAVDVAIRTTLDRMAIGGMNDQLGGGFHRYSVDRTWTVPHFEKMLYDNGQLLSVYARAAAEGSTRDAYYARVARSTADYLLTRMRRGPGPFFTAEDAEVNGREGLNYIWTAEELRAALSPEDAAFASAVFSVSGGPNFQDPHHPDAQPTNVLRLPDRPERLAAEHGLTLEAFFARLDALRSRLLAIRDTRTQPRLDDKILTSWNALAIHGLAQAGRLLAEPAYVRAAADAAAWLLRHHRDGSGRLLRTSRGLGNTGGGTGGSSGGAAARIPAMLEDYAMLAQGLLALARAEAGAGGTDWIAAARGLLEEADRHCGDGRGVPGGTQGPGGVVGYFDAPADAGELFVRARATYDGAMPSGVSAAAHAWLDLAELSGDRAAAERAAGVLRGISAAIAESPIATAGSTRALLRLLRLDAELARERLGADGAGEPSRSSRVPAGAAAGGPVAVYASEEQVLLAPDGAASFDLRLDIAPGYHLTSAHHAAGRGGPALEPLRVGVVGGTGVDAYADYPPGVLLVPSDPASPRVYTGTVEFTVALERRGDWTGRPALALTFQACTDRECLMPATVVLEVELRPVQA